MFDTGFLVLLFHFLLRNFFQKFPGIIFPFSEFYGVVQFGLFHAYTSDRVDSWITKNQIQISLIIFRYITILPVANKLMLNRYFFRMLQIEWIGLRLTSLPRSAALCTLPLPTSSLLNIFLKSTAALLKAY